MAIIFLKNIATVPGAAEANSAAGSATIATECAEGWAQRSLPCGSGKKYKRCCGA
jgi:uncharacterized protein YecA (UPF0149 family)